ncbi:MAG: hypothetical protein HFF10_07425 [Angelakisella sp.]|nr:hypothetical protein [Angelakisella sp.]
MNQPAAIINLEVYEDSVNLLGVAKVTLPSITYPTVSISGAGMMGNMDVPLLGMVDAMTSFWTPATPRPRLCCPSLASTSWRCGWPWNTGTWNRPRWVVGQTAT